MISVRALGLGSALALLFVSVAVEASLPPWKGWRTHPGSIYLNGPNQLPFNVDTGRYVGVSASAPAPSGGVALSGEYIAKGSNALRFPITTLETIPKAALVRGARVALRLPGPVGMAMLAIEGANLIWDVANKKWMQGSLPVGYIDLGGASATNQCFGSDPIGTVKYGSGGTACMVAPSRTHGCAGAPTDPPWAVANFFSDSSLSCHFRAAYNWRTTSGPYSPPSMIWNEATDAQLESAIDPKVTSGNAVDVFEGAVKNPSASSYINGQTSKPTTSGPASVNGGTNTTTTTTPSGVTTTTTDTTYNITYVTNVVNITENITTTTTHEDGTETTTEEEHKPTENPTPDEPPPDTPQEEKKDEPFDLCKEHPEASACAELGDPEGPDLDHEDRTFSLVPEGSDAGACPAPITFTAHGTPFEVKWDPICTVASGVRPVIIALAWLAAGIFLFNVAKDSR